MKWSSSSGNYLMITVGVLFLLCIRLNAMPCVQYISPSPGSKCVSQQSNIIIRWGYTLDRALESDSSVFSVRGSRSGSIGGRIVLSDDAKTLLFIPEKNFLPGEIISISVKNGLHAASGAELDSVHINFTVSPLSMQEKKALDQNAIELNHQSNKLSGMKKASGNGRTAFSPSTLPLPAIMISSQPAPGVILLSPWWGTLTETGTLPVFSDYNQFILIIDSTCQPIFYTPTTDRAFDFKMQPNGTLSYLSSNIVLNLNFQIVDSYTCGNGYQTDLHEFLLLPNGHALLLGLDPEPVDMSSVVPGGNSNATAIGFVIQELDRLKNVIFQWRSMDHFKVTDATHEDLTAVTIDYAHANALAFDADSNIIVSTRHMDEITKIDRTTGNVIWRWGGKNNQFTFINDTIGFSHQHSINRIDNGNFTIFDNGNFHAPPFSRAVEYKLDEQAKTATLVWQFRHTPDVYANSMGSVERLPNGNTFIGWGASNLAATEVRPDGSSVYEIQFPDNFFSYRALKYAWNNVTSISTPPQVPTAYSLDQNYPNPFNPSTNIKFSLPEVQFVSLKVYDILGKEITSLMNKTLLAGTYTVQWNANNTPSGVYFYRLTAGAYTMTKKLILLR
jgi:hypothetical protein